MYDILHTLGQGGVLYCAFVDFKKAFDFVVRDILWYKLIKMGGPWENFGCHKVDV